MARTEGGINNLNADDPVLNRQYFADASNQENIPAQYVAPPPKVKGVDDEIKEEETSQQPPSVTTTVSTQRQPVLTNQEKLSMFLLPMAAELMNAKTPGGMTNFQSFIQAAGRGLARIPQTIMGIKQLEAKGLDTKVTKRSDIQFTKPFTLDGKTFQPDQRAQLSAEEINAISQVDPTAIVPYKDPKSTSASIKAEKTGIATYLTEEEALKQNPVGTFGDFYKNLVAPTPDLVGKPIVAPNGQPLQYKEFFQGGNVFRKSLVPTSVKPQEPIQSTGSFARYVESEEEARAYLTANGINPNLPNYELLVDSLVAPSPSLVGTEVVEGNSFVTLNKDIKGEQVINANLVPFKGVKPNIVVSREERIKKLAKTLEEMRGQDEAVQRVETLLPLFLSGEAKTGKLDAATVGLRQLFRSVGFLSEEAAEKLGYQELIASASFALAPVMRATGSGSTSDMEFRAYQRAIVDLGATERTNYLTLYTFKALKELSMKRAQRERELLEQGASGEKIKTELKKLDTGIFATYKGDPNDSKAKSDFLDSLAPGTIVYQDPAQLAKYKNDAGDIVYPFTDQGAPNKKTFIIKGWKGGN
jgi:hypothetical protein